MYIIIKCSLSNIHDPCFNASQVGKNLKDKNIYNIYYIIKSIYEIAISAYSQNYEYKKFTLLPVTSKAASMKHEISFGSSPAAALYFALFLLILLIL